MPKIRLKLNDIHAAKHYSDDPDYNTEELGNNEYSGYVIPEGYKQYFKDIYKEGNYTFNQDRMSQNEAGSNEAQYKDEKIANVNEAILAIEGLNSQYLQILAKRLFNANDELKGLKEIIQRNIDESDDTLKTKDDIIELVGDKNRLPNYLFLKSNDDYLKYAKQLSSIYEQLGDFVNQIKRINKTCLIAINQAYSVYKNSIKEINNIFNNFTKDNNLEKVKLLDKKNKSETPFQSDLKNLKSELETNKYLESYNAIQKLFDENNLTLDNEIDFETFKSLNNNVVLHKTYSPKGIMNYNDNKETNSNLILSNLTDIQSGLDVKYAQRAALTVLKANGIKANNTSEIDAITDSLVIYCDDYDEAKKVYSALKKYFLAYYAIFFVGKMNDSDYINDLLNKSSSNSFSNLQLRLSANYNYYAKLISSLQDQLLIYITYQDDVDDREYIVKIINSISSDEFYSDFANANKELNSDSKYKTDREFGVSDDYIDLITNDFNRLKDNHKDWVDKVINKITTNRVVDIVALAKELIQPADSEVEIEEVNSDENSNQVETESSQI